MQPFRLMLWVLIVSIIALAAIGIAALLLPDLVPESERVLGSAALFAAVSLFALACASAYEGGRARPVMIIGLLAAAGALLIWLWFIWFDAVLEGTAAEVLLKIGGSFTTIMIWAAFLALVFMRRVEHAPMRRVRATAITIGSTVAAYFLIVIWFDLDDWWFLRGIGSTVTLVIWLAWASLFVQLAPANINLRRVSQATLVCGTVLAAYILLLIWGDGPHQEWIERLLGVLIILTVCGTLVTLSATTIERMSKRQRAVTVPGRLMLTLTCPRCDTTQQLKAGPARCSKCGLRIGIDIEEPRCACGYLLYKLTGENCPECGRPIPEQDRWAAKQQKVPTDAASSPPDTNQSNDS